MGEIIMQGTPAIIVMEEELKEMMIGAGRVAAQEIMDNMKEEITQDPVERQTNLLRAYIEDRKTITNPREHHASGRHIRKLKPNANGKPKSIAWFQTFKKESKLNKCFNRPSPDHGRLQEWCFEDIANAWDHFHRQRFMRQA